MGRDRADAFVAAGIMVLWYCEPLSSLLSVCVSRVGRTAGAPTSRRRSAALQHAMRCDAMPTTSLNALMLILSFACLSPYPGTQMAASALLPVRLVNKNGEGKRSPMDAPAPAPPSAAPGRGATDAALLAADGGLDAPWARGLGDLQPTGASRLGPYLGPYLAPI